MVLESILQANDRRTALIPRYQDIIASYKQHKDKSFKTTKKNLDDKYKACTEEIATLCKQLQGTDPDSSAKVLRDWWLGRV